MSNWIEQSLAKYPRETFTRAPTPLQHLRHLSAQVGPDIYLKRDDLTDLALGGDKPRKLEYELAAAREAGATCVVTCGSAQSNHARLTTAAARRLGLKCALVLSRDRFQQCQGNLLTVYLMGAEVHFVETADHWDLEQHADELCETLKSRGEQPHYIPVSGTTPLSCLGYVRAGLELAEQITEHEIKPAAVYTPFGTGGIFAATLFALRARGIRCPLVGISVNRDVDTCYDNLERWWGELRTLLSIKPSPRGPCEIHDSFVGRAYGDATEASLDAIMLMAETEGILLDPVYSGKTCAGLLAHCATGRWKADQKIVMIHSGGVPALFAYHEQIRAHLVHRGRIPDEANDDL